MSFKVGEIAILHSRPLSDISVWHLHGLECTIKSADGECPMCRNVTYRIEMQTGEKFVHVPEWALRKLRPPGEPANWADCAWRPVDNKVAEDVALARRLRDRVRRRLEELIGS